MQCYPISAPRSTRLVVPVLCKVGYYALLLLIAGVVRAQDSDKTEFDLPTGYAAKTFKLFAAQSGRGLIADADLVRKLRTRPVKGTFTPSDALTRMLRGTGFWATEDPKNGAFVVHRENADPNEQRAVPPTRGGRPKKQSQEKPNQTPDSPMKKNNPLAALVAWFALSVAPITPLHAADNTTGSGIISGRVQNTATGQYLINARVSIRGTDLVAFTDGTGRFVVSNVPTGSGLIDVVYTGMDPKQVAVEVANGSSITLNIGLTNVERYGADQGVTKLDSFVVATAREMAGDALAINEQRFAANIKNVVAADAHGDVTAGNVAELMKYIPGITIVEGGDGNANQVSVRGLDAALTNVSMDGSQVAHAGNAGNTRAFDFKGVNINSIARVEITKVPLPSSPADSMGGTVNMISKSAFELNRAEFRYRTYLSMNGEDFTLAKTPFPYEKKTFKAIPGIDLTYTKPINDRVGFVVNAANNIAYNVQDLNTMTWNGAGTATGATPERPYLQSYGFVDAPKYIYRQAASAKVDFRVTPNSVLTFNLLGSRFRDDNANYNWTFNAGTTGTSTVAGAAPLTYTPDSTSGALGRGVVSMGGGHHHITQTLISESLRYRLENGTWRIIAGAAYSESHAYNNAIGSYGHFNTLGITLRDPVRLVMSGFGGSRPDSIQAYNATNQLVDLHDINNYQLNTATTGQIRNNLEKMKSADIGVRRSLDFIPFPTTLEIGAAYRSQDRDSRRPTYTYTYNGINGNLSPAPFAARVYSTRSPISDRNVPWASPRIAYQAWEKNPGLFTVSSTQAVANRTSEITTSEAITEEVSALYAQATARLFNSRLEILSGVRFEKTEVEGFGPLMDPAAVWVRNANGSFARDSAGARIRKPEAGTVGSLEQLSLTHKERGYRATRTYDGYYPSTHVTINVTERLRARLAYAKTYGRPNFTEIIPNSTISESDVDLETNPTANPGTIDIRNSGLNPWSADNFDLSLEYYTDAGGLFSVGAFRKDISDFFGSIARVATAADIESFGLDPRYVGWTLRTKINAGDARISGMEFNFRHSLAFAGNWGKSFQAFVNGTKLDLDGNNEADWRGFVPEALNWGVTYSRRPFTVMAQWTYQGESQRAPVATMGANAYTFRQARTSMDLNIEYLFRPRMSAFANVRNVFNKYFTDWVYGPQTPDYAKFRVDNNNGTQFAIGVKGTF